MNVKKRLLIALTATMIVAVFAAMPASAQVLYGSIVGTVEDPTGAVVPGAERGSEAVMR